MGLFKKLFGKSNKKDFSTESPTKAAMHSKSIYFEAIVAFIDNFDNPDAIQDKILKLTKSDNKTTLIYLFIPYFFTRKVIPEVQWTDYYNIQTEDGATTSHKFKDSQTLMELKNDIDEHWQTYCGMDIKKILFHSGDFKAINELLHKGSNLENLEAVPPTILG
ncbi:hypothetical protein M0G43_01270 [Subsaxibacter sp. CAU 1640]|uniref:hypothetical protein n=1 Tax=Subsaxibacter sp. CAU 1640 TaxID=2933271 RepID=UPI002002A8A7|nr:hypothetical protein [Subsaxibacter sp. CAU 1640]MCK7589194.1 hypothetical protein [Subsaxibacter sp. CAU 1640]